MKFIKKFLSVALAGAIAFSSAAALNISDVFAVSKIKNTSGVGSVNADGMYTFDLVVDGGIEDPSKTTKIEYFFKGDPSNGFGGGLMLNTKKEGGWYQKESDYWGNEAQPIVAKDLGGGAYSIAISYSAGTFLAPGGDDYCATGHVQQWWQDAAPITITGVKVYAGSEVVYDSTAKKEEVKDDTAAASEQEITVKTKSKTFKAADLAKKAASFDIGASAKTDLSYKVTSKDSKKKVTFKNGKVTVKKGTKAGTYKIKVKITAAASDSYKKATANATITVKVK